MACRVLPLLTTLAVMKQRGRAAGDVPLAVFLSVPVVCVCVCVCVWVDVDVDVDVDVSSQSRDRLAQRDPQSKASRPRQPKDRQVQTRTGPLPARYTPSPPVLSWRAVLPCSPARPA